jgi:hypothetical protein
MIDGEQVREISREPFNGFLEQITLFQLAGANLFPPISFLYERAVLDEIGLYREDFPVLGDWELNLRFLSRWDIDVVTRPLAHYHHRITPTDGIYANTVMAARHLHKLYEAVLRNELLRADVKSGKTGLGHWTNVARELHELAQQMRGVEAQQRQMTTLFSYMKDKLWNAGKRVGLIRD